MQEEAERFDSKGASGVMVSTGEGVPKAVGRGAVTGGGEEGCGGWRQGTAAGIASPFQTNPELEGRVHR